MKLLSILLTSILLTGCLTAPVKRTFPDVPKELMEICPDLATVANDTTQLSEVMKVVTKNYSQYHECRIKNDLWIEWYNIQRKIFESVK
jgi:hypothetical protein